MKIILCDDDPSYLAKLQDQMNFWKESCHRSEAKIITFHSSEDLLEELEKGLQADIFFLDILFNSEMNGLDLASEIRKHDQKVMIVFLTNSEAYAKNGYGQIKPFFIHSPGNGYNIVYKEKMLQNCYNQRKMLMLLFVIFYGD